MKDWMDYATAPFIGLVTWVITDQAKTKNRITQLELNRAILGEKIDTIQRSLTKIDERQEDLIDHLLRVNK